MKMFPPMINLDYLQREILFDIVSSISEGRTSIFLPKQTMNMNLVDLDAQT